MKLYKKIITGGLIVASLAIGCEKKKPEELEKIVGVPKMPSTNFSRSGEYISFVVNLPDGKEVLCSYHGMNYGVKVNKLSAAIIDAYSDKQKISVYGKLNKNKMDFTEVDHPDFGKFKLKYK